MTTYAERIRQGEAKRKPNRIERPEQRFTPRELLEMRLQAYALLHLARTGWLPNQDKWFA